MPHDDDQAYDLLITQLDSVGFVERGSDALADVVIVRNHPNGDDSGDVAPSSPATRRVGWLRRALQSVGLTDAQVEDVERQMNLGEYFESRIHSDFSLMADHLFGDGELSREERIAASSAIGDALDAFRSNLESGDAAGLYRRGFGIGPDVAQAESNIVSDNDGTVESNEAVASTQEEPMPPETVSLTDEVRAGLDPDALAYIERLEAEAAASAEGDEGGDPVTNDEDVLRDAPPEVQELVRAANERADAAQATADEALERANDEAARRDEEAILRDAERFDAIGTPDEVADLLRSVEGEAREAMVRSFTAAQERMDSAEMWTEFGRSGRGEGSEPETQLQAEADVILSENPELTPEAAYVEAVKRNPAAMNKSRDEELKRARRG